VDVIVAASPAERERWIRTFCAERGRDAARAARHGAGGRSASRRGAILAYAAAGATDLMLGFVDFPGDDDARAIAREVVPRWPRGAAARRQSGSGS
jgi:hypothetical protein